VKILFICHRFPYPPNRGGKIRPFYMIKHLSDRHEVVVASLVRSPEEGKSGEGLQPFCKRYIMEHVTAPAALARMLARLPTAEPSSMGYFYSSRLAQRISSTLAVVDFDLIIVHCSSVAQYVEDVRGIPKLLDFGDMDSQKWLTYADIRRFPLSMGYRLEGSKLQRAETRLAAKFDLCTCTTRAEKATLDAFKAKTRTAWFPNGVNCDYFAPSTEAYDPNLLAFVGRMDYYPNVESMREFCETTWPLIRARNQQAKLVIVGADPSRAVLKLGRLNGVEITGTVSDVRQYVRRAAVCIAPLRIARGTQNKILESLAMGVPVVSSRIAATGVDAVPGEHLLTADLSGEFAAAVLRVLSDRGERRRLAEAGRERMLSHHSWEASMSRLDDLLRECCRGAATRI